MRRLVLVFTLSVVLAACTTYSLVEVERRTIAETYTIDPQVTWSTRKQGHTEVWTIDGPTLEGIWFFKNVGEDDTLFEVQDKSKVPLFKRDMSPSEIMEFVVDSMAAVKAADVKPSNLRPMNFGSAKGFRFELSFFDDGLKMQAIVAGAIIKDKLQLILYYGAREHYFAKHKGAAEGILASIKLL